ncbi:PREDICTED: uncharacterized protein LOC106787193 [Polistes canadensis]|uniref:uncharacterized protein LOC106787193 n=1 Tax=Polistes canadensis TaxID=91411 RepID=UPI000718B26D|nr:PREDICTED: uncharacterized protein LOC106787193 [Polistes canadensis]
MTKQDTLSRIFLNACVILLFFKNVRTYPQVEVDKSIQNGNKTISILNRKDQSSISETNRTHNRDVNSRARLFQYDNPKLLNQANEHEHIDGKFVFPTENIPYTDSLSYISSRILAPICHGSTFCERILDYPEEIINNAIQQNSSIQFFATIDVIPDVGKRIGVHNTPLCLSTEHVIYPRSAESKSKEWFVIVNQDNFKQGVRIETCSNENSQCNIMDNLPEGYNTICKQKYIYRQLAAVSKNGKIDVDMFRFPSNCCCHVKFTGDPATRLGIFGDQRNKQKTDINNPKIPI